LNQRPGLMTFSYRSCSTYVNSPDLRYRATSATTARCHLCVTLSGCGRVSSCYLAVGAVAGLRWR
jgi:hypothetical protein